MQPINRTSAQKKYRGKWIAFKSDRITVIASGSSAAQVASAAKEKGCKQPIVTRMPRALRAFVGFHV